MANTVKNTIPQKSNAWLKKLQSQVVIGVERGIEYMRYELLENRYFPRVTGRLAGSIAGRTGENVKRGDSVYDVRKKGFRVEGTFGTNVEYAKRVEYGFQGTDALGRAYNQQGGHYFTSLVTDSNVQQVFKSILITAIQEIT